MTNSPTSDRPTDLTDPVALRTRWTPAKKGGFSARGSELVEVSPGRVEFQATVVNRLFGLIFLAVGIGILLFAPDHWSEFVKAIAVLVFCSVGVVFTYQARRKIVFDADSREFLSQYPLSTERFPLSDIHAIQLLTEAVRNKGGDGSSFHYKSHEINLVLKSGRRVNVADHGDLEAIRADADRLANFLGVPVWDIT